MSKVLGHLALLAAAGTALTLNACGGIPGNAVVSVNGKAVTKATFHHWLGVAASSSAGAVPGQAAQSVVPEPPHYTACIAHLQATQTKPAKGQTAPTEAQLKSQCEQQYTTLKQEVLPFLISSEWVLGEAEERGIKVSDTEVQKKFNQVKNQQFPKEAEFQKFMTTTGQTISDLLLRVKLSMVTTKIQEKITKEAGKKPSQKEISDYYEKHKSQYGQPESRNILVILTKTQAQAEKAKKEISSGKSFASVAKKSSIDPSKSSGGSVPSAIKGSQPKPYDEALFSAKPNVLSGPVKTSFGYYVFEVKKINPATQQTLAQVQSQIQQQLTTESQRTKFEAFSKNFKKKWESRTECRSEYLVKDCKGYKEPKVPTTPNIPVTPRATPTTTTPAVHGQTTTTKKK